MLGKEETHVFASDNGINLFFYFHWQYFSLAADLKELPRQRIGLILLSFVVNYLYFVACSLLGISADCQLDLFAFLLFLKPCCSMSGRAGAPGSAR